MLTDQAPPLETWPPATDQPPGAKNSNSVYAGLDVRGGGGGARRKFSAAFKRDAVEVVRSSGRPIAEIAQELAMERPRARPHGMHDTAVVVFMNTPTAEATPERAQNKKAYLKSDLGFLGAGVPAIRRAAKNGPPPAS